RRGGEARGHMPPERDGSRGPGSSSNVSLSFLLPFFAALRRGGAAPASTRTYSSATSRSYPRIYTLGEGRAAPYGTADEPAGSPGRARARAGHGRVRSDHRRRCDRGYRGAVRSRPEDRVDVQLDGRQPQVGGQVRRQGAPRSGGPFFIVSPGQAVKPPAALLHSHEFIGMTVDRRYNAANRRRYA